ncbi:hypothetical protein SAY87_003330 [Trapa incisa]|uniref:FRIGIDA-like protein n=1 Tax=Trapa incisa TaxID=236973 RepID=A0AAN7KIZ3_9MYRT|nr:hypothetical protein SAY87_003330 [Trapa incisa]
MEDPLSVETLLDTTTSKIQQLEKAFAELESHRAITLNLKWKELEEHLRGLEKSLKRRFHELEDQEKEYQTKTTLAQELLEKREAAVVAKEDASLDKLQKKRDTAVSVIAIASGKHANGFSPETIIVHDEGQVHASVNEEKSLDAVSAGSSLVESKEYSENSVIDLEDEVCSYTQLGKLCKDMDSEGIHKFICDNRKNIASIREEIPFALRAAGNPAAFVLNCLRDFYGTYLPYLDGKKESSLLGLRRTCIMLMESLSALLASRNTGSVANIISDEIKQQARAIADKWKQKLDSLDLDASNGNSLEAHAFLQLLGTFGIASDFHDKYISGLIPMVSRRRQTAGLCRSLGLTEKMPGAVEALINSGRQLDAVNLAFAFELTEQYPPVPLVKSYLQDARKISSPVRHGNPSHTAQVDANDKELTALKAVIKCVEEHKLEDQYPIDPLQKRVVQLEKAKADKKVVTEVSKPQSKRPRANVLNAGHAPRVIPNIIADTKTFQFHHNRYPQYTYDRPYFYPGPADNHCPSILGPASAYNMTHAHMTAARPHSHMNFFGNSYPYQTAYLN